MNSIYEIDKNFKSQEVNRNNIKVYDIEKPPFVIYGVFKPEGDTEFLRMPRNVAKAVSVGVCELNRCTSGGRVRFKTNSKYIALKCILPNIAMLPHMPITGTSGFDLYADGEYVASYIPDNVYLDKYFKEFDADKDKFTGYEKIIEFDERKMRDIIINFPL